MNKKLTCLGFLIAISNPSYANLGGFEIEDGYKDFFNPVEKYNAGQFGANAGGGSYTSFSSANHNTGLWNKTQGNSNVYATAHFARDRTRSSDPTLSGTADGQPKALVITTNSAGWSGSAQKFEYTFDQYDMGVNPSSVNSSSTVSFSIWSCPGILSNNSMPDDFYGNSIAFKDSSGNVGVTVGYKMAKTTGVATIAYNYNGTWVDTGVEAARSHYQQWIVDLDLATDTVDVKIKDGGYTFTDLNTNATSTKGTGAVTNLINGQAMFQNMSNLTSLELISSPGVGNSKQWQLDDAEVTIDGAPAVPEPSSIALLSLGSLGLLVRRKR